MNILYKKIVEKLFFFIKPNMNSYLTLILSYVIIFIGDTMDFNTCLNNIQKQFNYDEEVMNLVSLAFKALLNYYNAYGNYSSKIYNLFMTTRIVPYNAGLDQYEEKENLMRKYSDKTEEVVLKHTILEGGELLHKIINNKIVTTVIVKRFDGKIPLETLVHELIHGLVTNLEIKEKDGKTYFKSGLSIEYLTPVNYVNNHFIEEGMTEYDAITACRLVGYNVDPSPNYFCLYDYAKTAMDDNYINSIITKTRLDGIDYISQIEDENYKDTLRSYINNFESVYSNKDPQEKKELIELNKQNIRKILNQKTK